MKGGMWACQQEEGRVLLTTTSWAHLAIMDGDDGGVPRWLGGASLWRRYHDRVWAQQLANKGGRTWLGSGAQ